jgi:hypothetical protein
MAMPVSGLGFTGGLGVVLVQGDERSGRRDQAIPSSGRDRIVERQGREITDEGVDVHLLLLPTIDRRVDVLVAEAEHEQLVPGARRRPGADDAP